MDLRLRNFTPEPLRLRRASFEGASLRPGMPAGFFRIAALKSSISAGPMASRGVFPNTGSRWSSRICRLVTTLECLLLFSLYVMKRGTNSLRVGARPSSFCFSFPKVPVRRAWRT